MLTNNEVIEGFIKNDHTIIRMVYRKQYPIMLKWLRKNNCEEIDANDIIQETFLIALRKFQFGSVRLECNFTTYLFSISKHLWFHKLRDRSRVIAYDLSHIINLPEQITDIENEEKRINIFMLQLSKLEKKCRQLLLLYCENKSLIEIVKIMGFKNPQAVADKKKNCRKKLIENLLNCDEFKE